MPNYLINEYSFFHFELMSDLDLDPIFPFQLCRIQGKKFGSPTLVIVKTETLRHLWTCFLFIIITLWLFLLHIILSRSVFRFRIRVPKMTRIRIHFLVQASGGVPALWETKVKKGCSLHRIQILFTNHLSNSN